MSELKQKKTKKEILTIIFHYFLIVAGSFILAFGTGVFLVPLNIVAGGLSGVGIVVDYLIKLINPTLDTVDITVWVLEVVLFILGLIFLGKKFTLHTLVGTVCVPLFLTLIYRTHIFDTLTNVFMVESASSGTLVPTSDVAMLLIAGLFGGAFCGVGVALTFVGGGSSGGVDIIYFIVNKYLGIKQSITSFAVDAIIIVVGMFVLGMNSFVNSLIGIISAFTTAILIQFIYVASSSYYVAEIVSDKWEEITDYIHDEMGRGTTLLDATGGYSGKNKQIVKVAFDKSQFIGLKTFIANTDPKAFVTITQATQIVGEGFEKPSENSKKKSNNKIDKK
jgi:uncharacterized membrane-anchored protein YitT (DUF2179 family)